MTSMRQHHKKNRCFVFAKRESARSKCFFNASGICGLHDFSFRLQPTKHLASQVVWLHNVPRYRLQVFTLRSPEFHTRKTHTKKLTTRWLLPRAWDVCKTFDERTQALRENASLPFPILPGVFKRKSKHQIFSEGFPQVKSECARGRNSGASR